MNRFTSTPVESHFTALQRTAGIETIIANMPAAHGVACTSQQSFVNACTHQAVDAARAVIGATSIECASLQALHGKQKRAGVSHMKFNEEHINEMMRTIVVDWMADICHTARIDSREVFEVAVHAIDVAIATVLVTKPRLQMLAVAALSLACKLLSMEFPDREWWAYMSDGAVATDAIVESERKLMQVLDFNIAFVVPCHFTRCWRHAFNLDSHPCCDAVSRFLVEVALMSSDALMHSADEVAAASLYIALQTCTKQAKPSLSCGTTAGATSTPFSAAQWKATTFSPKTLAPAVTFLRSRLRAMVSPDNTASQYRLQAASKQLQESGALHCHHSCLAEFVTLQLAKHKPALSST